MKSYLIMSLWVLSSSQNTTTNIILKINHVIAERSQEPSSCSASPSPLLYMLPFPSSSSFSLPFLSLHLLLPSLVWSDDRDR